MQGTFVGIVKTKLLERGSKSEHTGSVLATEAGEEFLLQKLGSRFDQDDFRKFDGMNCRVQGSLSGKRLVVTSIEAVDGKALSWIAEELSKECKFCQTMIPASATHCPICAEEA